MFVQLLAFGAALNAFSTAALPLSTSDLSQSLTPDISNEIRIIPEYDWTSSYVSDFTIHSSCNATERRELTSGLNEAVLLAEHAKQHVLVHGNTSSIFQKYFGKGPTGVVIGWLDKIASGNRAGILFRCDDIDQNCATQDGWAGHHRGSNASAETVICPLSYTTRRYLPSVCARGFDMATGRPADYWAADLMHRLYHVPLVGEDVVDHYADGYNGVLELAQGENYTFAGSNSATLTYFALEAYAYDIAVPGEGCVGKLVEGVDSGHGSTSASTTASTTSQSTTTLATTETATVNPVRIITTESTSTSATAIATETGGQECHTHDDGTLHCF